MAVRVTPLSYSLGAEVIGIDLREPVGEESFELIHRAFLKHCVLVFRDQNLTRPQHIAFSRRFGKVDTNDIAPRDRDPEHPEILFNTNKPNAGGLPAADGALTWHSDRVFSPTPGLATLLRGVALPDVGGDTLFANMYMAYETLSAGMRAMIADLYAIHPGGRRIIDDSTPERASQTKALSRPMAHPVVRVHPETGRKTLYIGPKVKQLVGFTAEESAPLIEFLCSHATRPQFVYRHRWRKNDLLVWDNRCTLHRAVGDYDKSQLRWLEKTCVIGSASGGYYYDAAS